jgi:hypothetical protein
MPTDLVPAAATLIPPASLVPQPQPSATAQDYARKSRAKNTRQADTADWTD